MEAVQGFVKNKKFEMDRRRLVDLKFSTIFSQKSLFPCLGTKLEIKRFLFLCDIGKVLSLHILR